MNTKLALTGVERERMAQDRKWGQQNHNPFIWLAILGEEVGEANKAALEGNGDEYLDELNQVAAVAVAAIECYYRQPTAASLRKATSIVENQLRLRQEDDKTCGAYDKGDLYQWYPCKLPAGHDGPHEWDEWLPEEDD